MSDVTARRTVNVGRTGCIASNYPYSQQMMQELVAKYGFVDIRKNRHEEINTAVVLGGDGFMLRMLHRFVGTDTHIYGINCGAVGFLLNRPTEFSLIEKIESASLTELYPIRADFFSCDGVANSALAFNEAYLMRSTCQAASMKVFVDGIERIGHLVADGIILATPAGSTAYNMSAGGMALPISSGLYALTPICAFRPKHWHGALIPDTSTIEFEVNLPTRREVCGFADFMEFSNISRVSLTRAKDALVRLLFDHDRSLEERVLCEQFPGA